jgi:putative ABC transport system ATP-binding protein
MSGEAATVIHLKNISKVFRGRGLETHALSGLELEIRQGEYLAVAGPSGCGKSTLLSIIGLLDAPTGGTYLLNGESVGGLSRNRKADLRNRKIGFVFQNFNLIGDMNVFDNVALPLQYGGVPANERSERVAQVLERVALQDRARHLPSQLSGGQQQRAAVARALVTQPEILLADEPTGNLDSKQGVAIMELLDQLHEEGTTICLVTHDPRYVGYAARKVDLLDGSVVNDSRLAAV